MEARGESRSFFFGWLVVAASCLVLMFTFGAAVSFGVYLKPLVDEFGWSRGAVSLAYAIFMLTSGVAAAISGKLHDRVGVRPVLFLAVLGGGLGLILASRTGSLWHLYFSFGVLAGGLGAGFSNAPVVATVGLWFDRRRGIATALAMSGASIGILLLPPVIRTLIDSIGWRGAFLSQGIVTLVLLLAAAVIIRAPRKGEAEPPSRAGGEKRRLEIPALPRPSTMWTLCCATVFCCICHSIPLVHVVPFASDIGIAPLAAASVMSVMGLMALIVRLGMGALADRITARVTLVISGVFQTFMMLLLIRATTLTDFYIFAVLWPLGFGGIMLMYPVSLRELYGTDRIGGRVGSVFAFATIGMAAGGYFGGLLFDLLGTYRLVFVMSFAAGLINLALTSTILYTTSGGRFLRLAQQDNA